VHNNIHNIKINISAMGSGMLNTIIIMDSGGKFRLPKKILKTQIQWATVLTKLLVHALQKNRIKVTE